MKKRILIIFSVLCVVVVFVFVLFNVILFPKKYTQYVDSYAKKYDVEQSLVYSIIRAESNFNPKAKSVAGAVGLMQILPSTASWIASKLNHADYYENQLYSPETNIEFGCYYLNYLFSKFKDTDVVVCAYNAGEGVVKKWLNEEGKLDESKVTYPETLEYLHKVKQGLKFYESNENLF